MTSGADGRQPMPGVPAIEVVELVEGGRTDLLATWEAVHLRHFSTYRHVIDEIAAEVEGNPLDDGVRAHVWLGFDADTHEPVAEFVFHTNFSRGAILNHFSAVDPATRAKLDPTWLRCLIDGTQAVAQAEADAAGVPLLLQVTEVPASHARAWPRLGLDAVPVTYGEPAHGRHWATHGDPKFLPIALMMRRTPAGAAHPYGELAVAGAEAFLLDHYHLPRDHPEVARMLTEAAEATEPQARR